MRMRQHKPWDVTNTTYTTATKPGEPKKAYAETNHIPGEVICSLIATNSYSLHRPDKWDRAETIEVAGLESTAVMKR